MAFQLYETQNPIDREQRRRINLNWDMITNRFSSVQNQISILSGGEDVEELIKRIGDGIANAETASNAANTAAQNAIDAIQNLGEESEKAKEATAEAQAATVAAVEATNTVNGLITQLNEKIPELEKLITDNEALKTELQTLQTDLTQLQTTLNEDIVKAQAATQAANTAAQLIQGWGTATVWNATTTYQKNNVVTFNRSTWQAKRENRAVQPVEGDDWILLAGAGVDGTGAVSSVNGIAPDAQGNVTLEVLTETDLEKHRIAEAPHQYGNKIEWRWNATTNSLDLVVL